MSTPGVYKLIANDGKQDFAKNNIVIDSLIRKVIEICKETSCAFKPNYGDELLVIYGCKIWVQNKINCININIYERDYDLSMNNVIHRYIQKLSRAVSIFMENYNSYKYQLATITEYVHDESILVSITELWYVYHNIGNIVYFKYLGQGLRYSNYKIDPIIPFENIIMSINEYFIQQRDVDGFNIKPLFISNNPDRQQVEVKYEGIFG